jgi:ElaB/YqjD/DUF883 family membrane-anchored ribosome-binding protein
MTALLTEATARRERLAASLGELSTRMTPENLLHEGMTHVRKSARAGARRAADRVAAVADDAAVLVGEHRGILIAGLVGAGIIAAAWRFWPQARRRRPVPIYAAYAMEDPGMMDEQDSRPTAWDRVRAEASHLGERAGDATAAAREATRTAARKARDAAGNVGEWSARQPSEHPVGLLVVGVALGAIAAVLLPGRRPRSRLERAEAMAADAAHEAAEKARHAYSQAAAATGRTRDRFQELADMAVEAAAEAGSALLAELGRKRG